MKSIVSFLAALSFLFPTLQAEESFDTLSISKPEQILENPLALVNIEGIPSSKSFPAEWAKLKSRLEKGVSSDMADDVLLRIQGYFLSEKGSLSDDQWKELTGMTREETKNEVYKELKSSYIPSNTINVDTLQWIAQLALTRENDKTQLESYFGGLLFALTSGRIEIIDLLNFYLNKEVHLERKFQGNIDLLISRADKRLSRIHPDEWGRLKRRLRDQIQD